MPNQVITILAQVLEEHPKAQIPERTYDTILYRLSDVPGNKERYVLIKTLEPLHYWGNDNWQEVDTDWGDSTIPGFIDQQDHVCFRAHTGPNAIWRIYPRRDVSTEYIGFLAPFGNLGERRRKNNVVTWDKPNFTIAILAGATTSKFEVTLKNKKAPLQIALPFKLTGLSLSPATLELTSAVEGIVVGRIRQPVIVSDGNGPLENECKVPMSTRGSVIFLDLDLTNLAYPVTIDFTVDMGARASSGGFDLDGPGFNDTATTINIGNVNATRKGLFVHFPNINVPRGATINNAYVTFTASATSNSETVNVNIHLFDVDSATPAPSSQLTCATLTLTTGTPWNNIPAWIVGQRQDTPNIKSEVQEIVNRPGWARGNDIMVIVKDDGSSPNAYRSVAACGNGVYATPSLFVDYTVARYSFGRVVFTCPSNLVVSPTS